MLVLFEPAVGQAGEVCGEKAKLLTSMPQGSERGCWIRDLDYASILGPIQEALCPVRKHEHAMSAQVSARNQPAVHETKQKSVKTGCTIPNRIRSC